MRHRIILMSALTALAAGKLLAMDPDGLMRLPDIQRVTKSTYLFENHSTAYLIWHANNIKQATLVHLDTHDDCRYIAPEILRILDSLVTSNDMLAIYKASDQSFNSRFITRPSDELFHLGNFIYPCIADGTVTNMYWVVPDLSLDTARLNGLKTHLTRILSPDITDFRISSNSITAKIRNCTLSVVTLNDLPKMPAGCLLDIDMDYFAFPSALSVNHIRTKLLHDPEYTFKVLGSKVARPRITTICSSVWGGYLPISLRFLSDSAFDYSAKGSYPKDAGILLNSTTALREGRISDVRLPEPKNNEYQAAAFYLKALYLLIKGDDALASEYAIRAAASKTVYLKGLLDCAEALTWKNKPDQAHRLVDVFEQKMSCPTTDSMPIRIKILISQGRLAEAETLGRKLVEWDRQPYQVNILGGVLVQLGKHEEAIGMFSSILKENPYDAIALYNTGLVRFRQGKSSEAIPLLEKSLAAKPDFSAPLEYLGCIYMDRKEYQKAIEHLSSAMRMSPMNLSAANNLGLSYYRSGKIKEAVEWLKKAVLINNASPETHANLATAYLAAGDRDKALTHINRALELKPDWAEMRKMREEAVNNYKLRISN